MGKLMIHGEPGLQAPFSSFGSEFYTHRRTTENPRSLVQESTPKSATLVIRSWVFSQTIEKCIWIAEFDTHVGIDFNTKHDQLVSGFQHEIGVPFFLKNQKLHDCVPFNYDTLRFWLGFVALFWGLRTETMDFVWVSWCWNSAAANRSGGFGSLKHFWLSNSPEPGIVSSSNI